jgi:hypothetical protein
VERGNKAIVKVLSLVSDLKLSWVKWDLLLPLVQRALKKLNV